jgi:hypothetical protein
MKNWFALGLLLLSSCATMRPGEGANPRQVEQLLFEQCPRVLAGELDLGNEGQLAALGLVRSKSILEWTYAATGEGDGRVEIGDRRFSDKRVCQVRFGGRDNRIILEELLKGARDRGWRGGPGASELGGFISFLYPPDTDKRRIMMIHHPKTRDMPEATSAGMIQDLP